MMAKQTAAVIIVGDEILRGQVTDLNSTYIANCLYVVGIKLLKIVVVPDIVEEISKEVRALSKLYSIVFTCGGVGPTHDDVTYQAIAESFNLKLEINNQLLNLYSKLLPNSSELHHLANVPNSAEIIHIDPKFVKYSFPVIKVKNVFILPGSPKYCRLAVIEITSHLQNGVLPFSTTVDVALDELSIVKILNEYVARWGDSLSVGSYPQAGMEVQTSITIEGNQDEVLKAKQDLITSLPSSVIINKIKFTLRDAHSVLCSALKETHVKNAFNILEYCYSTYKPSEIFISFNGGKDCTVVLHLVAALMHLRGLEPLLGLYFVDDSFPEVNSFVEQMESYYGLHLVRKNDTIQKGLNNLIKDRPHLKACLMGMRRNDPGSENLEPLCPTDPGWPKLMRINPILDWTYKQVWDFIRMHNVSYCSLYDQGYTSLGVKSKTKKNPLLEDPENSSAYLPAHSLSDDSTERKGRR